MGILAVSSGIYIIYRRIYTARIPIHMPEAFAKTRKATNILRPAIDVITLGAAEEILGATRFLKWKKLFLPVYPVPEPVFFLAGGPLRVCVQEQSWVLFFALNQDLEIVHNLCGTTWRKSRDQQIPTAGDIAGLEKF